MNDITLKEVTEGISSVYLTIYWFASLSISCKKKTEIFKIISIFHKKMKETFS